MAAALRDRYTPEREIGQGGMATVYLAKDLRHNRKVALKVLRPELGAVLGPERFLSEIQVTANLQHPHLLPLFDSGEAEGMLFYVMPYVEGESLRNRLDRERQLPVQEAVRIAAAVATALDYAHQRGVIHRDLKPENILLHAGQPLVADFGIALAVSNAGGLRVTQTGLSLGTPLYMSPEQTTGDRVLDGRSDVYALAAVTYEMLTGEPPHTGNTAQAIVARVLTEVPRRVGVSRPSVPEHVEHAVARGLEKLPADRWDTAAQFAEVLQGRATRALAESAGSRHASSESMEPARARGGRVRAIASWSGWLLLAGFVSAGWWTASRRPEPPATRFALSIPASQRFVPVSGRPVHFSADGRSVLYAGRGENGALTMYEYPLDALAPRAIPGVELEGGPFVSPDGLFVGVRHGGKVNVFPIKGGPATTVASVASLGEAWSSSGRIIMVDRSFLSVVSAAGGQVERLAVTLRAAREWYPRDPLALPDGRTVLFQTAGPGGDVLNVLDLETKNVRRVQGSAGNPIAVLDGWLLFGREDGSIMATRFDPATTLTLEDPVQLLGGAFWKYQGGVAASLSRDGSLVYVRSRFLDAELAVVDERGGTVARPGLPRASDPRFSPDGRQIAFTQVEAQSTDTDIWVHDIPSKVTRRVTTRGDAHAPAWTADGKRIAFIAADTARRGPSRVAWWIPADRSGPEEQLAALRANLQEISFSSDGAFAVLRTSGGSRPGAADMFLLPLSGERTPVPLFQAAFPQINPAISPDSRWLAYVSNESGERQVYLRSMSGTGGVVQVSAAGGSEPQWASDDRLFFRSGDSLVAATLSFTPAPVVEDRRALIEVPSQSGTARAQYGVHPNGREFIFQRVTSGDDFEVVVILNWLTEVREKLRQAEKP